MIKRVYSFLYFSALFVLSVSALLLIILFQKDVVPYLAQKYLKEHGVTYRDVKGTIFDGVVFKGLRYKDSAEAEELRVKYDFFMLLNPTPRVSSIKASGVFIDADKILDAKERSDSTLFALNISKADAQEMKIKYKDVIYSLNMSAQDASIRDEIDIKKIAIEAQTPYAKLFIEGAVKANRARGEATLLPKQKFYGDYLDFLVYKPDKIELLFDISDNEAQLKTSVKSIAFKDIQELILENIEINASYRFKDEFFTLLSAYNAIYAKSKVALKQKSRVMFNADITSKVEAKILQDDLGLPFDSFSIDVKRDSNLTELEFFAEDITVNAHTKDFKEIFLKADSIYADMDAKVELKEDSLSLTGTLYPKSDAPYLKEYDIERFSKLNVFVRKNEESLRASIGTDKLSLTLFKDEKGLRGILKTKENRLDIKGDIQRMELEVEAEVDSIRSLLSELELDLIDESILFDASAILRAKIYFDKRFEVDGRIDVPLYRLELDRENIYMDKNAYFEFFYADKEITLKKYDIGVLKKRLYSKKPSIISLAKRNKIVLKEFWVYDNLLVGGELNYSDMSADVTLKSDKFHYKSDDANVTLRAEIKVFADSNGLERISGDIEILGGVITYAPKKEYAIKDEDIIIIQDIKPPKKEHEKRELNIRVHSSHPIGYKIKDVELLITPNIVLYQDAGKAMQILGALQIHSGSVIISEREFEFEQSEIYFYDEHYMNPYLNLNLHYYTLDNIDIEIYVTNRVESPVWIFSSNPQMSQDDIISYILFGEAASSVFDASEKKSGSSLGTLALGAGLKELLNRSSNLKIDTLNILTNEEGTLGYEIGKRFGKRVRLVYKNDDISSLILQYSISRSIRVDVDVKETGQGVGIFYIKDFR